MTDGHYNSPDGLVKPSKKKSGFLHEIVTNRDYYLMALPALLLIFAFSYVPYVGLVIAFQKYMPARGILGSTFVGLKNFEFFVKSYKVFQVTTNTLVMNAYFIISCQIMGVFVALCVNEIRHKFFKRVTQSLVFLPYFLSWVVISGIIFSMLDLEQGTVNQFLTSIGLDPVRWYQSPQYWRGILTLANGWKWVGYTSVIYLASLSALDQSLFEAAYVDGATRWQGIWHITLPLLRPTMIILILLSVGRIFYGNFQMVYALVGSNGLLLSKVDVIDTFVFRSMLATGNFSFSVAISLVQSILGIICVWGSNALARRFSETSLF